MTQRNSAQKGQAFLVRKEMGGWWVLWWSWGCTGWRPQGLGLL